MGMECNVPTTNSPACPATVARKRVMRESTAPDMSGVTAAEASLTHG